MTPPKFRPCPSCDILNQANRKTCSACYGSLSTNKKKKEKEASFDSQWAQGVLRNRNHGRILHSARIAVKKLEAIGYKPILFIGKKNKRASKKWEADIMTHLPPTPSTKTLLEKMQRAYEFILTKEEQHEGPPKEQRDSTTKEQHDSPPEEETFTLNLVPVDPTLHFTSFSPSSSTTDTAVPPLDTAVPPLDTAVPPLDTAVPPLNTAVPPLDTAVPPLDTAVPPLDTAVPPLDTAIPPPNSSQSLRKRNRGTLSKEGPQVKTKRKGCQTCRKQKFFLVDYITGRRTKQGKAELKIRWLPCSVCGKTWDDTWEPASEFQHYTAMVDSSPLSGSAN